MPATYDELTADQIRRFIQFGLSEKAPEPLFYFAVKQFRTQPTLERGAALWDIFVHRQPEISVTQMAQGDFSLLRDQHRPEINSGRSPPR